MKVWCKFSHYISGEWRLPSILVRHGWNCLGWISYQKYQRLCRGHPNSPSYTSIPIKVPTTNITIIAKLSRLPLPSIALPSPCHIHVSSLLHSLSVPWQGWRVCPVLCLMAGLHGTSEGTLSASRSLCLPLPPQPASPLLCPSWSIFLLLLPASYFFYFLFY